MCRFYGYCRVSTSTQAEKGYGLETQKQAIQKYAKSNKIELERIFVDAGISGNLRDDEDDTALGKRAALMEMLSIVSDGDTIVVLNTSRLWRSDMTKALIRRELLRHGVEVLSIEQPKYSLQASDPSDYLIQTLMETLDVYERMNIALKLARGRTVKARGGDKPSGVTPYGYRYTANKKAVEVVPEESPAVRFMFSECQKGASLHRIAEMLNDQGYTTRRGKPWQAGSVQAILRNRFYIGELQHQGQTIQGNHEAIISRVQFGKCAAQLERKRRGVHLTRAKEEQQ